MGNTRLVDKDEKELTRDNFLGNVGVVPEIQTPTRDVNNTNNRRNLNTENTIHNVSDDAKRYDVIPSGNGAGPAPSLQQSKKNEQIQVALRLLRDTLAKKRNFKNESLHNILGIDSLLNSNLDADMTSGLRKAKEAKKGLSKSVLNTLDEAELFSVRSRGLSHEFIKEVGKNHEKIASSNSALASISHRLNPKFVEKIDTDGSGEITLDEVKQFTNIKMVPPNQSLTSHLMKSSLVMQQKSQHEITDNKKDEEKLLDLKKTRLDASEWVLDTSVTRAVNTSKDAVIDGVDFLFTEMQRIWLGDASSTDFSMLLPSVVVASLLAPFQVSFTNRHRYTQLIFGMPMILLILFALYYDYNAICILENETASHVVNDSDGINSKNMKTGFKFDAWLFLFITAAIEIFIVVFRFTLYKKTCHFLATHQNKDHHAFKHIGGSNYSPNELGIGPMTAEDDRKAMQESRDHLKSIFYHGQEYLVYRYRHDMDSLRVLTKLKELFDIPWGVHALFIASKLYCSPDCQAEIIRFSILVYCFTFLITLLPHSLRAFLYIFESLNLVRGFPEWVQRKAAQMDEKQYQNTGTILPVYSLLAKIVTSRKDAERIRDSIRINKLRNLMKRRRIVHLKQVSVCAKMDSVREDTLKNVPDDLKMRLRNAGIIKPVGHHIHLKKMMGRLGHKHSSLKDPVKNLQMYKNKSQNKSEKYGKHVKHSKRRTKVHPLLDVDSANHTGFVDLGELNEEPGEEHSNDKLKSDTMKAMHASIRDAHLNSMKVDHEEHKSMSKELLGAVHTEVQQSWEDLLILKDQIRCHSLMQHHNIIKNNTGISSSVRSSKVNRVNKNKRTHHEKNQAQSAWI